VPRTLLISELRISQRTARKLVDKHGLQAADVRTAVENVGRLPFRWDNHPERGWRAIVVTVVDDRVCLVVLYPASGEIGTVWNLGSAYEI
jgi:hypothetical protein